MKRSLRITAHSLPPQPPICSCNMMDGLMIVSTMNDFQGCTNWEPWDLVDNLLGGEMSFGSLIDACGDLDGITIDPEGCLHAIHDVADDDDNIFHSYISDIYDDPNKYCGCNKDLLGGE